MDATAGAALGRVHCGPASTARHLLREPRTVGSRVGWGRVSVRPRGIAGAGFADEAHLRYYASPARCAGKKKERKEVVKRRARLVEGLAALQSVGGGLGLAVAGGELEEGKMTITEAADVLLAQLELLRSKEKEMKKKKKEEKGMKMKACNESESSEEDQEEMKRNKMEQKAATTATVKKAKDCGKCEDSSSSSSSESSDSDCEEEVIDMSNLRTAPQDVEPITEKSLTESPPENNFNPSVVASMVEEKAKDVNNSLRSSPECGSTSIANGVNSSTSTCCGGTTANDASTSTCCSSTIANGVNSNSSTSSCYGTSISSNPVVMATEATAPMERIEVCMGGKCKKSGAMELMQEFERRVSIEGAVVGCKCMGKCRAGPNVRVRSMYSEGDDETVKATRNPLCIGVGLDDVGTIVANFFAEKKDMGSLFAA